jgi:AcrR family transcriptional regulator
MPKKIEATQTKKRGRPRCDDINKKILETTYEMLQEMSFNSLTIEGIAARAEVGKPTIYLRWSNKASLVMDAFLAATTAELAFPDTGSVKEDVRLQMQQLVKLMNSPRGQIVATIIGGGQTDPELIEVFRHNWLLARRMEAKKAIERGIDRGELPVGLDLELAIDLLYSPLFYRLLLRHQSLSDNFVDELIDMAMKGLMKAEGF